MKRSIINKAIEEAKKMLEDNHLMLPAFGYWDLDIWKINKSKIDNVEKIMLGWDVTDYGHGKFNEIGSVLFTIRNGHLEDNTFGTPYAEKLIFLLGESGQEIPFHYHGKKTEDIINRGGGILSLEFYHSTNDDKLDEKSPITMKFDGMGRTVAPGEIVELNKGSSVTITPTIYHRFWAKQGCGNLVVGEISSINDDNTDNSFLLETDRFVRIEEDEPISHPLCNEYSKIL